MALHRRLEKKRSCPGRAVRQQRGYIVCCMSKALRAVVLGGVAGIVLGFLVGLALFAIFGGPLLDYELAAGLFGAIFGGLFGAFSGGLLRVPRSYS